MRSAHRRALIALATLALGACSADPQPDQPSKSAPDAAAPARSYPSLEARTARYEGRATVEAPSGLPSQWRRALDALGGRLTAIEWRRHSHTQGGPRLASLRLEARLFGTDEANQQRIAAALKAAGLAGDYTGVDYSAPAGPKGQWQIEHFPLVAPPGEARELRVVLRWQAPPAPAAHGECRRPPALELLAPAPKAARIWTGAQRTRRVIGAHVTRTPKGESVDLAVWFRNAEVLDYGVKQLAERAQRQGFSQRSEGRAQIWTKGGSDLHLSDDRDPPSPGCEYIGMVMQLRWRG